MSEIDIKTLIESSRSQLIEMEKKWYEVKLPDRFQGKKAKMIGRRLREALTYVNELEKLVTV